MIVFEIEELEDFFTLLSRRLSDEVFFYIEKDVDPDGTGLSESGRHTIVLHFLGQVTEGVPALYQTVIHFPKKLPPDLILKEIRATFDKWAIKIIKGRISELFYSLS